MQAVTYDPNDNDEAGDWHDEPAPPVVSLVFGMIAAALLAVLVLCWIGYL